MPTEKDLARAFIHWLTPTWVNLKPATRSFVKVSQSRAGSSLGPCSTASPSHEQAAGSIVEQPGLEMTPIKNTSATDGELAYHATVLAPED